MEMESIFKEQKKYGIISVIWGDGEKNIEISKYGQ